MLNREAQKQRITEFFNSVTVNGVAREVRFGEQSDEGYIEVELHSALTDTLVHLSIPVTNAAMPPQDTVIAEILGKTVQPSECSDLASISLLSASGYSDSAVYAQFYKYGEARLSDTSLDDESMDRFCAAWIAWRVKHYKAPSEDNDLGEIDDHPF